MAYIHRSLERKFLKMSSAFKAVMVTGARQVGKSTMLKYLAQDTGRTYVSWMMRISGSWRKVIRNSSFRCISLLSL